MDLSLNISSIVISFGFIRTRIMQNSVLMLKLRIMLSLIEQQNAKKPEGVPSGFLRCPNGTPFFGQ